MAPTATRHVNFKFFSRFQNLPKQKGGKWSKFKTEGAQIQGSSVFTEPWACVV